MNGAGYRFPMATPPRPSAHDTPAIHERALEDLSFIRRTMEGASSFTDVPGLGLVLIGVSALGTAPLAAAQPNAARWMGVWIADAVVAVLVGGGLMWRKMQAVVRRLTRAKVVYVMGFGLSANLAGMLVQHLQPFCPHVVECSSPAIAPWP